MQSQGGSDKNDSAIEHEQQQFLLRHFTINGLIKYKFITTCCCCVLGRHLLYIYILIACLVFLNK